MTQTTAANADDFSTNGGGNPGPKVSVAFNFHSTVILSLHQNSDVFYQNYAAATKGEAATKIPSVSRFHEKAPSLIDVGVTRKMLTSPNKQK